MSQRGGRRGGSSTASPTPSRGRGGSRGRRNSSTPSPQYRGGRQSYRSSPFNSNNTNSRVFGSGLGAVEYEKEKGDVFKVGPPAGQRYQIKAFLSELTKFVMMHQQQQHTQQEEEDISSAEALSQLTLDNDAKADDSLEPEMKNSSPTDINKPHREWWPPSPEEAVLTDTTAAVMIVPEPQPIRLSIRLEKRDITDTEVGILADWADKMAGKAVIVKLWLFGGRLGDAGAYHVARMISSDTTEVHLSHNMITLDGFIAVLKAVPAMNPPPKTPLWLRAEWNRISGRGLVTALEELYDGSGLLVDVPEASRADAAPSLPTLPRYYDEYKDDGRKKASTPPTRPGGRNALRPILGQCHVRLPWIGSQYELPEEAEVLQAARKCYSTASNDGSSGVLLIVTDTSALLPMIGADARVAAPTSFTLELLLSLSDKGLFGRALPESERVFIVVPDGVIKQLDSLKSDPGVKTAVRKFMSSGLDEYGPAGASFLTVLGAHQGEGLVMDKRAEVAGSRAMVAGGQATDAKIVEVALFFQTEILRSQNNTTTSTNHPLPVVLLSGDNGQLAMAKAHGLPAVRMSDLKKSLAPLLQEYSTTSTATPLTASLLRSIVRQEAVKGLGAAATKSLQTEFDQAIACLHEAVDRLAACTTSSVQEQSDNKEFVKAMEKQLQEWDTMVLSYHSSGFVTSGY